MKRLSIFSWAFISAIFLFCVGCNKDKYDPDPKTKTQLISQSSWKYQSATAAGVAYSIQACEQDNVYNFLSAGTGSRVENIACNSGAPGVVFFGWSFQSNETEISFTVPVFGVSLIKLVSLSETSLVVEYTYTPPSGPSVLLSLTLVH